MKKLAILCSLIASFTLVPKVFSAANDDPAIRLQQIENKVSTLNSKVATNSAKTKTTSLTYTDGKLLAVNGSILLLGTADGTKILYTSDSTKYFSLDSSGKKLIGLGDLKLGDSLLVLGLAPNELSGAAKIIVRNPAVSEDKTFSMISRLAQVKDSSLILKAYTRDDLADITTQLTTETLVTSKAKVIKIFDLKTNNKIVVLGTIDDKGNLTAKEIRLLN